MARERIIQVIALIVLITAVAASGSMLPGLIKMSDRYALRYTNVSVQGAPPIVAVGQSIGVLRGLIVDYLWIKVNANKEKGLFYEVMADADLITKLQPRFAEVWAFHGHNMAYNISVATHTQQERWEWVNAGIRLVRNEGVRYNPNDVELHKELAFWFANKIEGYADDAHLYYKTEFCREWNSILGEPPVAWPDRTAWIKEVADAPESLDEAEQRTPGVKALVEKLQATLSPFDRGRKLELNNRFLQSYANWQAVTQQSDVAQFTGAAQKYRSEFPLFRAFDDLASTKDPAELAAWKTLVLHVRKRVLLDEYNMSPQVMYEYTRDLGPIDWRHGQAHALYWARRGMQLGEARAFNDDDIYKVINNDRLQLQAMQSLARHGRITFDPFSSELPSRFPEPLWVEAIFTAFDYFYVQHYKTRGWGGDTFIAFLENFMTSAVTECYRSGEIERAKEIMARMDEKLGRGARIPNSKWSQPLDLFVQEATRNEYASNPELAPLEVASGLRYGIRVGIGRDREDVYRQSVNFARTVTDYFKGNENYNYINVFGERRIGALIGRLETSLQDTFTQIMVDPNLALLERATIWSKVDKYEPTLRARVYDQVIGHLRTQLEQSSYGQRYTAVQMFPPPPNLEEMRARLAEERARKEKELEEQRARDNLAPSG